MKVELYKPTAEGCCEACVFDRGEHAPWCDVVFCGCACGRELLFHQGQRMPVAWCPCRRLWRLGQPWPEGFWTIQLLEEWSNYESAAQFQSAVEHGYYLWAWS